MSVHFQHWICITNEWDPVFSIAMRNDTLSITSFPWEFPNYLIITFLFGCERTFTSGEQTVNVWQSGGHVEGPIRRIGSFEDDLDIILYPGWEIFALAEPQILGREEADENERKEILRKCLDKRGQFPYILSFHFGSLERGIQCGVAGVGREHRTQCQDCFSGIDATLLMIPVEYSYGPHVRSQNIHDVEGNQRRRLRFLLIETFLFIHVCGKGGGEEGG